MPPFRLSCHCMDTRNDKQLETLWNDILRERDTDYESANERRKRLDRLHTELGWEKKGFFFPTWAVAASVLLLVGCFSAVLLTRREVPLLKEQLCLLAPEAARSCVTLPDGTKVWLNAGSRLRYAGNESSWENRDVTLEGEAFFDVVRDEHHPFTVHTGEIRVQVLGTRFNVRNSSVSGDYQVVLSSGRVDVSIPGQERVKLSPGEMMECSKTSGEISVRKVEASNYTSWTGDAVRFDNRTLKDVAVNLEHRYNVRVTLAEGVPEQERISFRITNETLAEAMQVVSRLAHVRCRIDTDEVVIEKK